MAKIRFIIIFYIMSSLPNALQAFELMQVTGVQTNIVQGGTAARSEEEAYSTLENPEVIANIISPPKLIKGYIAFNRQVGTLSFSILSPKKTIIYLDWDNKSLYPRRGRKIKFRRAGEYQSIVFNATRTSSGYIYLYNSNIKSTRKLLRKIPYLIEKQRAYSQSIRASFRKQGNNSDDEESKIDTTLSYSINQRVNIGEPRWSAGAQITSDKSIGVSIGYSW